jgi:hypothetical protein
MEKKIFLLVIATFCVGLYFYGQYVKDNDYFKYLPTIGGLAFGLNTLVGLAN